MPAASAGILPSPWEKRKLRRVYEPTIWGIEFALREALCSGSEDWEAVEEIARSNSKLWPLVLGRWEYFKNKGVDEFAKERLIATIVRFSVHPKAWDETSAKIENGGKRVEELTCYFFERWVHWVGKREEWLKWCRALGEDPEICSFVSSHLKKNAP
jgi:hypothetical protein